MLQLPNQATKNEVPNQYTEDTVIKAYKCKGLFVKMLLEPKRFTTKHTSLESGFSRVLTEVSELKERKCVQVSPVSYLSPAMRFSLFRDIGFILEIRPPDIKAMFSNDVGSRVLGVNHMPCHWDRDKKCFIDMFNATTDVNGEFTLRPLEWKHKATTFSELIDKNRLTLSHNECIVKYAPDSILGLIVDTDRYKESGLGDSEIQEDCQPVIELLKNELGVTVEIYLYNSLTGELVKA